MHIHTAEKRVGLLAIALFLLSVAGEAVAAPLPFTQCPADTGNWPSCAYLLTINPDNSVTQQADLNLLQSIFNNQLDPEDILIGVLNNSGQTQYGLQISGDLLQGPEFFDFDEDFPYTGSGNISFSNYPNPCPIDACGTGNVSFIGGLANGASTWFGLEGSAQLEGEPILLGAAVPESVPEPATIALLGIGLAGLGFSHRKRKRAR